MWAFERRWLVHIAEGFLPSWPLPVDVHAAFARIEQRSTKKAAFTMRLAIWLLVLSPLWRFRSFHLLHGLAPEQRAEHLQELLAHRSYAIRELTLLLKVVVSFALFVKPAAREYVQYNKVIPTNVLPIAPP